MRVPKLKLSRDTILFTIGTGGIVFETMLGIISRADPTLVVVFAGLLTAPIVIRTDEHHAEDKPPLPVKDEASP